jgi:hypothetical protein
MNNKYFQEGYKYAKTANKQKCVILQPSMDSPKGPFLINVNVNGSV